MKLIATLFSAAQGWIAEAAIAILLALSIFGAGYLKGTTSERLTAAQQKLDIALAYAKEITDRQAIADGLEIDNQALRAAQQLKDRIITREVIRYAQVTPTDRRCTLPGSFRLLHDAAATGTPADPGAGSVAAGEAAPIEDATVLETIDDNYRNCRDAIAKVSAWQARWEKLEAAP